MEAVGSNASSDPSLLCLRMVNLRLWVGKSTDKVAAKGNEVGATGTCTRRS